MEIALLLALGLALYASGNLRQFGLSPGPATYRPGTIPQNTLPVAAANQQAIIQQVEGGVPINQPVSSINVPGMALSSAASVGTGALASAGGTATILGLSGAALGAATAGVGAVVGIFAALWSAHEKRIAQAKNENAAVNVGVQGFDQDIRLVNAQYNAGQIDAQTAIRALQQILAQFWALTTPQIQPGRDGCSGGQACGTMQQVLASGKQPCSGSIGAACCVGCAPLYYSLYAIGNEAGVNPSGAGAVTVLQHGGGTSVVKTVYGNKYGVVTRNGYSLIWGHP